MDFFERQDAARRSTKLLVFYFVVAVALLIVAVYAAVLVIFIGVRMNESLAGSHFNWWEPKWFFFTALGTLAVVLIGSASKTMELSAGGAAVAEMLGGRLLNPNTTEPDERKLLNVVEEMAVASGVPVPQVYLLADEEGINAFAAGRSTGDAVIGVTSGAMKLLTRDELQGVIGHEFSHILNGDMRLNLRLIGMIFGILCLTVIGRILLRTRGRKNPLPLLGLALIVIGWVGVLFGRLIQAAVSRQREFLADASAVQFTRNPDGLATALKKIGGLAYGSKIESAHAEEASHLFFANGLSDSFFGLMATHPPLEERIRLLDPHFDGKFPRVALDHVEHFVPPPPKPKPRPLGTAFPGFPRPPGGMAGMIPPVIAAHAVLPNAGRPTSQHLRYAEELRNSVPPSLQYATRDPLGASTLLYALLLSDDEAARKKQVQELASATSEMIVCEALKVWPEVQRVATNVKLPFVDVALPALRRLSTAQFEEFRRAVKTLIESDNEIDLFEYVLQKVVVRHLESHFVPARRTVTQFYALRPLVADCGVLLSAVAYIGQDDAAQAQSAFVQGAQALSHAAQSEIPFLPEAQCDLDQVDVALNRLAQAVPQIRKNILNACAQTIAADGIIREREAELLRGIADVLDCPIPPFVQPETKSAVSVA